MTALHGQSLRRHPRHRSGELEALVMDLWEAGLGTAAIARRIDRKEEMVKRVLGYMREGAADAAMHRRSIAPCSEALLAAIARAHPERVAR